MARRCPACRRRESDPLAPVENAGRRGPILFSVPRGGCGDERERAEQRKLRGVEYRFVARWRTSS